MQFVAVQRDNVTDVLSVHRVVWVINFVALYQGLIKINIKIFIVFECQNTEPRVLLVGRSQGLCILQLPTVTSKDGHK